jgi:hypothetical protein
MEFQEQRRLGLVSLSVSANVVYLLQFVQIITKWLK